MTGMVPSFCQLVQLVIMVQRLLQQKGFAMKMLIVAAMMRMVVINAVARATLFFQARRLEVGGVRRELPLDFGQRVQISGRDQRAFAASSVNGVQVGLVVVIAVAVVFVKARPRRGLPHLLHGVG